MGNGCRDPQPGPGKDPGECPLFLMFVLELSCEDPSANQPVSFITDTNGASYQGPVHMNHTTLKEIFFKITFIFFLFLSC